jgi:hypothetical protein
LDSHILAFKSTAFTLILVSGLFLTIVGFLGFFFTCCKTKGCAVAYGIFLLFAWVLAFASGAIVAAA